MQGEKLGIWLREPISCSLFNGAISRVPDWSVAIMTEAVVYLGSGFWCAGNWQRGVEWTVCLVCWRLLRQMEVDWRAAPAQSWVFRDAFYSDSKDSTNAPLICTTCQNTNAPDDDIVIAKVRLEASALSVRVRLRMCTDASRVLETNMVCFTMMSGSFYIYQRTI